MKPATRATILFSLAALTLVAAEKYQKPSKAVMDVLNAPITPTLQLNPAHTYAMQAQPVRYPPLAELAQPMLRIAGMRINPKTNGLHNTIFNSSLMLRKIPEGTEIKVDLPPNPKLSGARWSPDGKQFAFTNTTPAGIELWIGDTTGKTHKVEGVRVNAVMGGGRGGGGGGGRGGFPGGGGGGNVQWMPDGKSLLVYSIRADRGAAPGLPLVPPGPHVQESLGGGAPALTLEDMLPARMTRICSSITPPRSSRSWISATGKITPIGKPGHHRLGAHLAQRQGLAGDHHSQAVFVPARRTAPSPRKSKSGTSPARCCTKWPACRWKTRCRSTACSPGRAAFSGVPASPPRCCGWKRWMAAT